MEIIFLTLDEVIELQKNELHLYGGKFGIREQSLLESAVFAPQAGFDGKYLYKDIYEMAGIYLFHICQNQAFVDGNKRTAVVSAIVFLELNGIDFIADKNNLFNITLQIANKEITDRSVIADFFRENSRKSPFLFNN